MFTPKRNIDLNLQNASRVTRSHSLKTKTEIASPNLNGSGLNKISLNLGLIYNDTLLQSYKSPLPIKINEIISKIKSQDSSTFTVTMLANGHVCFVHEKKLFIWKLKKSLKNLQCIELSLPQSRLMVKKNCVSVECLNNRDYVALVATADGFLRYWPSVFNEYLCVDIKYDVQPNDEISHLMYVTENHYLIFTSNGLLASVVIETIDDKVIPVVKQVDTSSGFISSVGRRMTSLIFGSSSQFNLNKNVQNFKSAVRYSDSSDLYVLVDKNLQKFHINNDLSYSFTHQVNMEKLIYEEYLLRNPDSIRASLVLQSASITKNSIYVLALVEDNGFKFAIAEINTTNSTMESKLKSFHVLNYILNNFDAQNQFNVHALDNQYSLYIFNPNLITLFTGPTFDFSGESKFNTLGDRLADSNFYENELLFFSLNHGILKTKENFLRLSIEEESLSRTAIDHSNNRSNLIDKTNMSMNESAFPTGDDTTSFSFKGKMNSLDFTFSNLTTSDQSILVRLKEAFQLYLRKDEAEVKLLIDEVLRVTGCDKKLDTLCVEFSEKLIDDMPHQDPRWAELSSKGKSFNTNLIISNQLKGKLKFHEYYITFLKQYHIWDKLTVINYNNRNILTTLALEEHGEKLNCAIIIREQLYTKNPELINAAIEYIAKDREESNLKSIYPHDIFFRKISKIQEIFNALFLVENEVIKVNSNEQSISYMIDTTSFLCKLLSSAQSFYKEKKRSYENNNTNDIEYNRWAFLPIKDSLNKVPSMLGLCIRQHKLCSDFGLLNCNSLENKTTILETLTTLISLICEEYELKLDSITNMNESYFHFKSDYDSLKTKLIEPLLKHKQIDTAIKLAEKYIDFNTLITVCEMKNDFELLESYLDKFSQQNIAEFVVKHFMEKKTLNFLLKSNFLKRPDLSKCFDKYSFLAWIKDIKTDRFVEAANTLEILGTDEKSSFMKKRSLLSLSKLSLIANDQLDFKQNKQINTLNRQLDLLAHFDNIPINTIKGLGLVPDQIPVYKVDKLIELLIKDENATEREFINAFELLNFLNDDNKIIYSDAQKKELIIEILVHSILADNWEMFYTEDYPETKLNGTKFYKTICSLKEKDKLYEFVSSLREDLLNHELTEHLSSNKKFSYILQTCLEMIESS